MRCYAGQGRAELKLPSWEYSSDLPEANNPHLVRSLGIGRVHALGFTLSILFLLLLAAHHAVRKIS